MRQGDSGARAEAAAGWCSLTSQQFQGEKVDRRALMMPYAVSGLPILHNTSAACSDETGMWTWQTSTNTAKITTLTAHLSEESRRGLQGERQDAAMHALVAHLEAMIASSQFPQK